MVQPTSRAATEQSGDMCLVLAVVHDEDTEPAIAALTTAGFAITRMHTVGAFLRQGNSTLVIGVERVRVAQVTHLLQETCNERTELAVPTVLADYTGMIPMEPVEVMHGGATIFVLDVERYERL